MLGDLERVALGRACDSGPGRVARAGRRGAAVTPRAEAAAAVELGGENVRLHLEITARLWFYSDGALDLPSYSLGVDVGPPGWHGTLYVHGLNVVIPYVLGMRLAHSPPPVEGRNAPFFAVRLEKPLGTLPPTVHAELGVQWWLDRSRRPERDPLPSQEEL